MADTTPAIDPVPILRVQAVKYVAVASMALLGYDSLLVFDREVELIWKNFTVGWRSRVLYLLARYIPMVSVICGMGYYVFNDQTPERCRVLDTFATWLTTIGVIVSEAILVARTCALWSGNRKLSMSLFCLLAALTIVALVCVDRFTKSLKYAVHPSGSIYGCYPVEGSDIIFGAFMTILFLEAVILGLTIHRARWHYFQTTNHFIRKLYRDSLGFAFCVFTITLTNVVIMATMPTEFADLLNRPMAAIHSIISTRIVLDLREVLKSSSVPSGTGHSFSHDIIHSLRFADMRDLDTLEDAAAMEVGRPRSALELGHRSSEHKEEEHSVGAKALLKPQTDSCSTTSMGHC